MEDKLYHLLKYYEKSPQLCKTILGGLYSKVPVKVRYGKRYVHFKRMLRESQWWPIEKHREEQIKKLQELIVHAYLNVPYYKEKLGAHSIKPNMIHDFDDFSGMPFLTKMDIKNNLDRLTGTNIPKSQWLYITTGGSTGIPVGFYLQKGMSRARELAFMTTQWERVDYKLNDKGLFIRGSFIGKENKIWEYDPIKNVIMISSYHLTEKKLPGIIEKIRKFRPKFVQAYPSSLYIIARFMLDHNIPHFESVNALLCGSENIYPYQRKIFEEVFKTRVYSWYGHSERVALGGECEKSSNYHFFPEYGYLELINKNGEPCQQEGEIGEIIATGFDNWVMPLIRYRTMDMGVLTKGKCSCGREYPMLKRIEGRMHEFIITKTQRLISMTAINMHSPVFDNVEQFQFFQDKVGEVNFKFVRRNGFSQADISKINKELQTKLGKDMILNLVEVESISKNKNGKFTFLKQKLDLDNFEGK